MFQVNIWLRLLNQSLFFFYNNRNLIINFKNQKILKKVVILFFVLMHIVINLSSDQIIEKKENNKKEFKYRQIIDFWINPYIYDFQYEASGININSFLMTGAALDKFTIGGEIFYKYFFLKNHDLTK